MRRNAPPVQLFPRSFNQSPSHSIMLEFKANTDISNLSIGPTQIANALILCTGTTAAYPLIDTIKIERVMIWGMAPGNVTSTIQFEWNGDRSPSVLHSDTGNSVNPAHINSVPPANSLAGYWYDVYGAAVPSSVMNVTKMNNGDVLRIVIKFTMYNATIPVTGTGGVAGQIQFNGLSSTLDSTHSKKASSFWS